MANLNWTTKTNDVDDVVAEDFNNLVSSIETELNKKVDKVTGKGLSTNDYTDTDKAEIAKVKDKVDKVTGKGLIDTDVADNISIKNYGTNDVFTVATPEVDFKFVNAETINILTADDIHWGTNTTLQTELDKKVDKVDGKGLSTNDYTDTEKTEVEKVKDKADKTEVEAKDTALKETIETLKEKSIPHTTASEYPVSVSDHLEGESIIDYKVYGNSIQDGTPTPDNPVEIQSVGDLVTDEASEYYGKYDIPIMVAGKNLLPYPYYQGSKTINGVTFTDNGDGSITVNGTATANAILYLVDKQNNYTLDRCGLKIGDSYTISKTLISGDGMANIYFAANYYNENGSMKEGASVSNLNTATATIQSDFVMWGIYLLVLKDKTVNNTTIQLQLEKGSTATAYETYKGSVTSHIYLNEPLRKIGDYADYIDFKNQKVVRNIKYIRLEPTLDYKIWTYNDVDYGFLVNLTNSISECKVLSNCFKSVTDNKLPANKDNSIYLKSVLYIGTANWTTVDHFKSWLSDNITYLAYILKKPTEEPITVPELSVLNSEVMNVSSSTATQPSMIDLTYYQNINKVINNLTNAILAQGGNV